MLNFKMPCRTHGGASAPKQTTLEFVPKRELDRAQEEIERLREKNQALEQQIDGLHKGVG